MRADWNTARRSSQLTSIASALSVATAFGIAAWGGIALTSGFGRVASIWFANGILVAALLMGPRERSRWALVLCASFLANVSVNLLVGDRALTALAISAANSLESFIAAWFLRDVLHTSRDLLRERVVLRFFVFALGLAPLSGAIVAAAALSMTTGADPLAIALVWLPADVLGMGVMTPLMLALNPRRLLAQFASRPHRSFLAPLAVLALVVIGVFSQSRYPLSFLIAPPLLWVVFRAGFTGAALAISLIATVAIAGTIGGTGPFMLVADAPTAERVFTMQLFLCSLILMAYPVCAMLAAQRRLMHESDQHVAALSASQATVTSLNERMMLAARAAGVGFYSWDLLTQRIEWDAQLYRMFAIDPDSGPPSYDAWRARVHPLDIERAERALQAALTSGRDLEMDFRMVAPDGAMRDLRCCGVVQRDAQGRALKLIGLNIDVTELRRLERMKSEFVSIVSHELRTPLTSIRAALGLLASGAVGPDKVREVTALAARNAERLATLVDDILDMERIESGKMRFDMRRCALGPLVEQSIAANASYAARHQAHIRFTDHARGVQVRVDSNRLLQVLANLLSNAAKFSPPGGAIDVSIALQDERVRIAVRDHGPGIAPHFQPHLFGKFCQADASDTRAKSGSGLGLAISRALIEGMGGSISFETRAGEGATFFLELRRARSDEATGEMAPLELPNAS